MKAIKKLEDLTTIDQLAEFLSGGQAVAFSVISDKDAAYRWIHGALVKFKYLSLGRREKGVVIRYLMEISGYSRQQLTRLIAQYRKTGRLQRHQRTVCGFQQKYTERDIRLLAALDERHNTPSGPAAKKLCAQACEIFGQMEYASLAAISVSHLYNLRKSAPYARHRGHFKKIRPLRSSIGERRKAHPNGRTGYFRIDTVHQGDKDERNAFTTSAPSTSNA